MSDRAARPIVKWAGGKTQLLPELRRRLPEQIDTYYEPFTGGAALWFALAAHGAPPPRRAVLGDVNEELIATYRAVRDDVDAVIAALGELAGAYLGADAAGREAMYYRVRDDRPRGRVGVAARTLFLNKTCFNGLYRVNSAGRFNVPHGRYRHPVILDEPNLRAAAQALAVVELRTGDFAAVVETAGPGDFAYFDPPFEPLSPTSSFTAYTGAGFGRRDQLRLREVLDRLTRRGVRAMLSNSAHAWILDLYRAGGYDGAGYSMAVVQARRAINARGSGRGAIGELLLTNYPPPA